MIILHLIAQLSGGGAERQLSYLAPALAENGHVVHVAYLRTGPDDSPLSAEDVVFHKIDTAGNYDPRLFTSFYSLCRNVRPDVIHSWIQQSHIVAGVVSCCLGIPWLLREPASADHYQGSAKSKLCEMIASRWAGMIVSNSAKGDLHWRLRAPDTKRRVIPNAIPLADICNAPARERSLDRLKPDEKLILYAGRFCNRQKNLALLLDALRLVLDRVPARVVLCGEGAYAPVLSEAAQRLGLASRFQLKGFVKDIWSYMKAADAFVSISHYEGRPNTVLEAMACGCPIVASDIPEHREFLDETTAWLVDRNDPEAVASALQEALYAGQERARKAKARAQEFSIKAMVAAYLNAYTELVAHRPKR